MKQLMNCKCFWHFSLLFLNTFHFFFRYKSIKVTFSGKSYKIISEVHITRLYQPFYFQMLDSRVMKYKYKNNKNDTVE